MKTRRISIREAQPNMVTAEDIYTYNNQLVISQGALLTDLVITKLKFYSISHFHIYVGDGYIAPPPVISPKVDEVKSPPSPLKKLKETPEFKQFTQSFVSSVKEFKGSLKNVITVDEPIDTDSLLEHTTNILADARNGLHVFNMLHNLRSFDDLTYVHSINVSLIARVFGGWLKMSDEDIDVLTLAGLLHDIGKLTLPSTVMNKIEPLTSDELTLLKSHSIRGFKILQDKDIDPRVKAAALLHHERMDGSGYPKGVQGNDIPVFARIIAIADVYDAMTSARVYRSAICPFDAIAMFEQEGYQKFDPKFLYIFLENICQSYIGHHVRLSNGVAGEVVMLNKHSLAKPMVKTDTDFIDLSKHSNLKIEAIL